MMVALLCYAYSQGALSSRAIERACATDIAFRVVTGNQGPDHTVISRFRQTHEQGLAGLFSQVLALCAEAGLRRVGVIAIDGTKIAGNASALKNRRLEWFQQQAAVLVRQAGEVDRGEDQDDDGMGGPGGLGPGWRDRSGRAERIKAGLEQLQSAQQAQAQELERAEQETVRARHGYEQAVREREVKRGESARRGPQMKDEETYTLKRSRRRAERLERKVQALAGQCGHSDVNVTDLEAKRMKTTTGWVQGYNAQTAVSEDGLIVAVQVTNCTVDMGCFVPMMDAAVEAVTECFPVEEDTGVAPKIGVVLADAGYFSEQNLVAAGPDRLIAAGKRRDLVGHSGRSRDPDAGKRPACSAMVNALKDPANQELYKKRGAVVEPVNGHLKDRRGLRRASRRGLKAVTAEVVMAAWVTNLARVFNQGLRIRALTY